MKSFLHPLTLAICLIAHLITAGCSAVENRHDAPANASASNDEKPKPILRNLLSSKLERVDNTEVIVSHVTIPLHTALPKHYHPGEEFGYVLEGSVTLWRKGKPDRVAKKGDVIKIPLKQIHTAMTKDEGATILVFRVHEHGKPERVLAD